ncbi:hypothetical protein, partial [Burkholderia contaminans]|uniref:hypothetical protein n=1 Tax=Burkholderia contaminans TaxID=488447 RepID=UPI0021AB1CCD
MRDMRGTAQRLAFTHGARIIRRSRRRGLAWQRRQFQIRAEFDNAAYILRMDADQAILPVISKPLRLVRAAPLRCQIAISLLQRHACMPSRQNRPCASNGAPSHRARTKTPFAGSRRSFRKHVLHDIQTGVVRRGLHTVPKYSVHLLDARADESDETPRHRDMLNTGSSYRTDRSRISLIRVVDDIEIDTARASLAILIPATSVRMDEVPLAFASTDRVTTLLLRKIPFVGLPTHRGPEVAPLRMILTSSTREIEPSGP